MKCKDICLEALVKKEGAEEITGERTQGKMRKMPKIRLLSRHKPVGQRKWQKCP